MNVYRDRFPKNALKGNVVCTATQIKNKLIEAALN